LTKKTLEAQPAMVANVFVTPEMVEAGAEIISEQFGEITTYEPWPARDVAERVFLAMAGFASKCRPVYKGRCKKRRAP